MPTRTPTTYWVPKPSRRVMSALHRARYTTLAAGLRTLLTSKFNMADWVSETRGGCATVCCAFGHCPAFFPEDHFTYERSPSSSYSYDGPPILLPAYNGVVGWEGVDAFFGNYSILVDRGPDDLEDPDKSEELSQFIFSGVGVGYPSRVTPRDVADRIEKCLRCFQEPKARAPRKPQTATKRKVKNVPPFPECPRRYGQTREATQEALHRHGIAEHLHDGLLRYIHDRIIPGKFLCAAISNDLTEAVRRADPTSLRSLGPLIDFLNMEVPPACWGSPDAVSAWIK